mgnify:FL=1
MLSNEERIATLESEVKQLKADLKKVGSATPLTIPIKTLVYIEGIAILLLVCIIAYILPLVMR